MATLYTMLKDRAETVDKAPLHSKKFRDAAAEFRYLDAELRLHVRDSLHQHYDGLISTFELFTRLASALGVDVVVPEPERQVSQS